MSVLLVCCNEFALWCVTSHRDSVFIVIALARCALKRLLDNLLLLQTTMLASSADTKSVLQADDSTSSQHSDTQSVQSSVLVM